MLWDDFLNSDYHDWRGKGNDQDRLDKPEWIKSWLEQHDLGGSELPTDETLLSLKRFRDLLLKAAKEASVGRLSQETLDWLNGLMSHGPVIRSIRAADGKYEVNYYPQSSDWMAIMAEVAASFASSLAGGASERIRICDNPDCCWVYVDDTRNASKRYCDDKMCGNLMKVRRFRAKQKAEKLRRER